MTDRGPGENEATAIELRSRVMSQAYESVSSFWHADSGTHIYFNRSIGNFGVKGVGDFANEAYSAFSDRLSALVKDADEAELREWVERLSRAVQARKRERELEEVSRRATPTVNLEMPAALKSEIRRRAVQLGVSMTAYCVKRIVGSLERIRTELEESTKEEVQKRFVCSVASGKKRESLKFALDPRVQAEVTVLAREWQARVPDLYRSVLALDVDLE